MRAIKGRSTGLKLVLIVCALLSMQQFRAAIGDVSKMSDAYDVAYDVAYALAYTVAGDGSNQSQVTVADSYAVAGDGSNQSQGTVAEADSLVVSSSERVEDFIKDLVYDLPRRSTASLPPWLRQYIDWHNSMREKFPHDQIIDHPDSPPTLIISCTINCGGLHDRMGDLDKAVIFANASGRVILFSWHHPYPLEEFLRPNLLNWTVPHHPRFTRENITQERRLIEGWSKNLKQACALYCWHNRTAKHVKVVTAKCGDFNGNKMKPDLSLYSKIWQSLFAPSVGLQKELQKTFAGSNLQPGNYTATHVRTRHPARYAGGRNPAGRNGSVADVTGLPWGGDLMESAIKAGVHAVNCSRLLLGSPEEPIYFYSDSEDLVQYMVMNGSSSPTVTSNTTIMSQLNHLTPSVTRVVRVVSRDTSNVPAVHIDRAAGDLPKVEVYYSTFIDLYMGAMARCVSFGVGNYAYLATKISATTCLQRHETASSKQLISKWGMGAGAKAPMCPLL
jgi:glycosyltransferase involved in cell wall biosynthesis